MSLAPEPSYFVKAMVAFLVLNEFFYKDRRYGRAVYLAVVAAIVFQIVAAMAGVSVVYLGVAAAAKAVSIVWEKEDRERSSPRRPPSSWPRDSPRFSSSRDPESRAESTSRRSNGHLDPAVQTATPPGRRRARAEQLPDTIRQDKIPRRRRPFSAEKLLESSLPFIRGTEHVHPTRQPDLEPLRRVDRNEGGRIRAGNGRLGPGPALDAQIRRRETPLGRPERRRIRPGRLRAGSGRPRVPFRAALAHRRQSPPGADLPRPGMDDPGPDLSGRGDLGIGGFPALRASCSESTDTCA